jgi:hypothetical protein
MIVLQNVAFIIPDEAVLYTWIIGDCRGNQDEANCKE